MQQTTFARKLCSVLLFLAAIALLAVCTQYDLQINQTFYQPTFAPAVFMEAFGWWPLYLPGLIWGGFLLRRNGHPVWGTIISLGSACAMWLPTLSYLQKRNWLAQLPVWAGAALVTVTFVCAVLFAGIPGRRTTMRLSLLCCSGFFMMALVNIAANIIKLIWNRSRFDDMLAAGTLSEQFTPWYLPFGNGGSSFPSAHTAAAAGVLLLLLAADIFPLVKRHSWLSGIFCTLYICAMGVCRVVIGRHFLSDTIAGALVAWALYLIARHSTVWKNALAHLKDRLTAL